MGDFVYLLVLVPIVFKGIFSLLVFTNGILTGNQLLNLGFLYALIANLRQSLSLLSFRVSIPKGRSASW